jgi:hypothetical protein
MSLKKCNALNIGNIDIVGRQVGLKLSLFYFYKLGVL